MSDATRAKIAAAHTGERSHQYGKRAANYQGWQRHRDGYMQIVVPDHPFAGGKGKLVMEHRLVMEAWLRENEPDSPYLIDVKGVSYLRRDIEIHHLNHVRDDNRIENLQCLTKAEHAAHHQEMKRAARREPVAGEVWTSRSGRENGRTAVVVAVTDEFVEMRGRTQRSRVLRDNFHETYKLAESS